MSSKLVTRKNFFWYALQFQNHSNLLPTYRVISSGSQNMRRMINGFRALYISKDLAVSSFILSPLWPNAAA